MLQLRTVVAKKAHMRLFLCGQAAVYLFHLLIRYALCLHTIKFRSLRRRTRGSLDGLPKRQVAESC